MQVVVSVEDVHFRYNSEDVLKDVSFELRKGEYLGIVGPNGSGKTTLLKIMLGYFKPTSGKVEIFGESPWTLKRKDLIGYLPQVTPVRSLIFPATVKDVVLMGLLSKKRFPRVITKKDVERAEEILSVMRIIDLKNRHVGELSGGERQKVFLCRALIHEPSLLVLDEPVTALDPESREEFYRILMELNREKEITIIMVTHDMGEIGNYATKLLYLDRKVVFFGSLEKFCESREMTEYFGEHAQHIICHRHDKREW
ncbi:MAG: metal ABC transporter ATP-binding protein [Deltaproteobacteria bacterium]|nr:metal ABC transporter ATP-binding protein [Deltaproteobacteria bacterium]